MTAAAKRIDWEMVKRDLARREAEFERSSVDDPQRLARVWHERARRLAARPDEGPDGKSVAVLMFRVGKERCALELAKLSGVTVPGAVTALPASPPEVIGVFNRRGTVRTLFDLARMLNIAGDAAARGYVVLLRHGSDEMALRVDALDEIRRIDFSAVRPTEAGSDFASRCRTGLAADSTVVLSAEGLLSHPLVQGDQRA